MCQDDVFSLICHFEITAKLYMALKALFLIIMQILRSLHVAVFITLKKMRLSFF